MGSNPREDTTCHVYESLYTPQPQSLLSHRGGRLVTDPGLYDRWERFLAPGSVKWRSGIKHDCSKVMELRRAEGSGRYTNGLGETLSLEQDYLYPMLKSSDVARKSGPVPSRFMLVPQESVGQETDSIRETAPLTWNYLQTHGGRLDNRRSSIYRRKPRFSVFGVGDYTFTQWKVAVSGFYKDTRFQAVGPSEGRPVVLDDTCYFLPCPTQDAAEELAETLNSPLARELLSVFLFTDAKRPVTANILQNINLVALAEELGQNVPSWL